MLKIVFITMLTAFVSVSQAAVLELIVENGQLMGADNVSVGGSLYDVRFLDGTCIDLFNGCDENTVFTFNTEGDARLAATALIDTVFVDGADGLFDMTPSLTYGCESLDCGVITPYQGIDSMVFLAVEAFNDNPVGDGVFGASWSPFQDLTGFPSYVFADWSVSSADAVSAPSASIILLMSIAGLLVSQRRKQA